MGKAALELIGESLGAFYGRESLSSQRAVVAQGLGVVALSVPLDELFEEFLQGPETFGRSLGLWLLMLLLPMLLLLGIIRILQ
jgi:hypothetical protein